MSATRPKGSSFAFADQGVFVSAYDVGCRTGKSAADNKTLIVAALTAMTSGGVLLIPHGVLHNFTSADFPVTAQALCVWEFTGTSFKLTSNQTLNADVGEILASLRIDSPKVVEINFVDVLTDPPAYTFKQSVYNNVGTPVISGSSFDLCTFLPGSATPVEAIARSGAIPGLHYFLKGIYTLGTIADKGVVRGSRSIQAPATAASIVMNPLVERLILNHAATIATLSIALPATAVDGQRAHIFSRSIVTTLTLTAGTGTIETGHTIATLAALSAVEYIYDLATTKWYRVR